MAARNGGMTGGPGYVGPGFDPRTSEAMMRGPHPPSGGQEAHFGAYAASSSGAMVAGGGGAAGVSMGMGVGMGIGTGGYSNSAAMDTGNFVVKLPERATHLLAVCETCMVVLRVNGHDMSYRRIMERKCPRCGGMISLPQEVMEMLILYGHFIPETVASTIAMGATATHPSLRADFVAAAMNELLVPLQTNFVYDVALPKRADGLGMSLRMHKGDLVVGGFIDFDDGSESPSVAARIISVGDILVAINKKSITSASFEKNIRLLSHAASPVYLTFRRSRPVTVL